MGRDRLLPLALAANAAVFIAVLLVGGLLFFTLPRSHVSLDEKRDLAKPPHLTLPAAASGKFSRDADDYYSDNFIFRDFFITLAARIKEARGFPDSELEVYEETRSAPKPEVAGASFAPAPAEDLDAPYEQVRAVVVTRGRAVQIFGGGKVLAEPFADMVNRYQQVLGPGVKIYCMAIPSGSDMFLPNKVNAGVMKEKINIDHFYSRLNPGIVPVDAYGALLLHRNEYIQFHTDHHWTGLGAYYAYTAFSRAAGFETLPLRALVHKRIPGFLGSLYYRTRSSELKARGDYVDYFMVPGQTQTTVFRRGFTAGTPGLLYYERATGGGAYGVFLGGDNPLMRVVTSNRSGRRILVVKDSYGNAFAPYLAAHYDEVFIADYRYFRGNIPALMREYGIGELLFAYNTFVINNPSTARRGLTALGSAGDGPG